MFKQAGRRRPAKQKMVDTDDMIPQYQAALNELKQELATEWDAVKASYYNVIVVIEFIMQFNICRLH